MSPSKWCIILGRSSRRKRRVHSFDEITERVRPVAEQYGADSVYVSGLYGRGEAQPGNDIDFLVSTSKVQGIAIGGLFLDLKEAIRKKIDVVTDRSDPRIIAIYRRMWCVSMEGPTRRRLTLIKIEGEVYLHVRHHHRMP